MTEIRIITPQFERIEKIDFDHVPTDEKEFMHIINHAPWEILKGYGFRKWDKMNEIIAENKAGVMREDIEVPLHDMDLKPTGETYTIKCKQDCPIDLLEIDEDVILFPGEWYDIIPNGLLVTGLYGESYPFIKGESDDDIRFGCLPYGIRRPIN